MSLRDFLSDRGVPDDAIAEAEAEGERALQVLAIDRLLLPGEPRLTQQEVADQAGVELERARRYWRALGFPDVEPDERAFGQMDVESLATLREMLESGVIDPDVALQMTRVVGQAMATVAEAEVGAIRQRLEAPLLDAGADDSDVADAVGEIAAMVLPKTEGFLTYTWRRHLAAAARRAAYLTETGDDRDPTVAVGFADLVGFTALSQQMDERELATVVERFESVAYDTVAAEGGRIVKMIGDEVMFAAGETRAAVRIGLTLASTFADDETLSDVRVGLACGPALAREGDLFGPTVNLASRLVNLAYPGTVLTSDDVHAALEGDPELRWKRTRPRRLKGIGFTTLWVLQWADDDESSGHPLAEVARRVRARRLSR